MLGENASPISSEDTKNEVSTKIDQATALTMEIKVLFIYLYLSFFHFKTAKFQNHTLNKIINILRYVFRILKMKRKVFFSIFTKPKTKSNNLRSQDQTLF